MARLTGYRQYEDKPFGYGEFDLDDGTSYVLDDPERARSVLGLLGGDSSIASDVANESQNIAERGSADRQGETLSNRQLLENAAAKLAGAPEPIKPFRGIDTGASQMRRAVAGPGGGDDDLDARQRELSAELDEPQGERQDLMQRGPADEERDDLVMRTGDDPGSIEPLSAEQLSPEELERVRFNEQARSLVRKRTPGTDPRSLGPGVAVEKNFSREGGLAPQEYNDQFGYRQRAHDAGNQTIARHYVEDEAAAAIQTERLRSEAIGLKQQNDAQELELQKRGQKYQEDRAWLEQDVDKWYDKKASPDGGLRERRGLLGNGLSAVAQFMGAYAAIISNTPNFANQILNRQMDMAVEAQLEDFRRGRAKRDGQLQRMADRGMDLNQMRSALKVQQELVLRKEVEARSIEEGTREAKQAAERLLADRDETRATKETALRTEALGKQTVSGEYVRPTAGRELSPLEQLLEENKGKRALLEGNHLDRGGDYAVAEEERAMKREQRDIEKNKLSEPQAKAESAHQAVTNLGSKAGLVRDKSGKWVVGDGAVPPGLLQKAGEAVTGGLYQGDIAPAFDAAVEAFGRQQSGGVIGKDERPALEVQLGQKTFSRKQLADRLNAAELNIEAKRKKDLDDIRSGRTNAAPSSWQSGNRR
jgi:hypothetical protein